MQVRRGFSILLVLFFALGPLTALSSAGEDASLPACCRRNGAHECAMSMHGIAAGRVTQPDAAPIAKAPSHCPYYPQHPTVRTAPVYAPAASLSAAPGLPAKKYEPRAYNCTPLQVLCGAISVRGPPAVTSI